MRSSGREGHILIWMRDAVLADRLRRIFERRGFGTTWAAALPEAIAALDADFPCAVACTLSGRTPSFMDLETILAYQVLGHRFVSLPPVPIWALTSDPASHAPEIETLGMPVHLVPQDLGPEGLVDQIRRFRNRSGLGRLGPAREASRVLLALDNAGEGTYISRYLGSHGIEAQAATGPREALKMLREQSYRVLVSEDFSDRSEGESYWREVGQSWRRLPVLLIDGNDQRLARVSPLTFPQGIAGALSKPIQVGTLQASLRRLLRITMIPEAAAVGAVGRSA